MNRLAGANMPRLGAALCWLILLACATSWMVRREANAYRASLSNQRPQRWSRLINPPVMGDEKGPAEPSPHELAAAAPAASPANGGAPAAVSTQASESAPSKGESLSKKPEAPARDTDASSTRASATKPESAPAQVANRPQPDPAAKQIKSGASQPNPVEVLAIPRMDFGKDPLNLTARQERDLGRAVHQAIARQFPTRPAPQRIIEAARPLLERRQRKDIDYHFHVLDSHDVNAFSHAGGYIYLCNGILDLVTDEAELQFVLAHEIAHVDLKHGLKRAAELMGNRESDADPGLGQTIYHLIAAGYDPDDESQADDWAYKQLRALGRSRREALAFLLRYTYYLERNPSEARPRRSPTDLTAPVQSIEDHFPLHPPPSERRERLRSGVGAR